MTQAELYQGLQTISLPVAYREFKNPPDPPYLIYLFTYSNDVMADNQNYADINNFQVEIYTKNKDLDIEKMVQNKLTELGFSYFKTETFLQSESLFQLVFEIQLIGG